MEPNRDEHSRVPAPTLYPIGFAAGIAVVLVGLIVNPKIIAPIGGAIAIVFAALWVRDATTEYRGAPPEPIEPERRAAGLGEDPPIHAQYGAAAVEEPAP